MAADVIAREIRRQPRLVLGLAAGSTPTGTYSELVRMHREEGLDFSGVVFFSLDEYCGLPPNAPQSFTCFLNESLLDHISPRRTQVYLVNPSALAKDPYYCENFEREIRDAGGIGVQILGIGRNGHIAFNEPGSAVDSRTRLVTLESTHADLSVKQAITMGIGTILEARTILLLASGEEKARVLAQAIEGPLTRAIPASALQLHPDVTVIADKASSQNLTLERTR
jgi:glucosamine-6-phosphate deaminase